MLKRNKMEFDYGKTAAFTGHRSQKLPFGFNETLPSALKLRAAIRAEIEYAVLCGYMFFLTGMALGTDMIAAEEVLSLKKELYPHIELIAALPCRGAQRLSTSTTDLTSTAVCRRATAILSTTALCLLRFTTANRAVQAQQFPWREKKVMPWS